MKIPALTTLAVFGGPRAARRASSAPPPGAGRIGRDEELAVLSVLRSRRLGRHASPSSRVSELERFFARKLGVQHALAVNSGTSALACALIGLGLGSGDEVLLPAYAWITTACAVLSVGATPVVCEIDETLTLDVADAQRRITGRTKAVIAVHMLGAPCRMDAIRRMSRRHGLAVLEDVAQAPGGSFRGRRLGTLGDASAFSLQQSKTVSSGEGGLVGTSDSRLFSRAASHHDGSTPPATGEWLPGLNLRMTELNAAVALAQLRRLDTVVSALRRCHAQLRRALTDVVLAKNCRFRPSHDDSGETGSSLVVIFPTTALARLSAAALRAEGVPARVLYEPEHVDLHVYRFWKPVLGLAARSVNVRPATVSILGRSVQTDVSPDWTQREIAAVGRAFRKVLLGLS